MLCEGSGHFLLYFIEKTNYFLKRIPFLWFKLFIYNGGSLTSMRFKFPSGSFFTTAPLISYRAVYTLACPIMQLFSRWNSAARCTNPSKHTGQGLQGKSHQPLVWGGKHDVISVTDIPISQKPHLEMVKQLESGAAFVWLEWKPVAENEKNGGKNHLISEFLHNEPYFKVTQVPSCHFVLKLRSAGAARIFILHHRAQ